MSSASPAHDKLNIPKMMPDNVVGNGQDTLVLFSKRSGLLASQNKHLNPRLAEPKNEGIENVGKRQAGVPWRLTNITVTMSFTILRWQTSI